MAPRHMTLGEIDRARDGKPTRNASTLMDLNEKQLKSPNSTAGGHGGKIPQRNLPGPGSFAVLSALLAMVGLGWIMKQKTTPADGL